MKSVYKVTMVLFLAVALFTANIFSQSSDNEMDKVVRKAFETFPASLKSEFPGIVESTIYNLILVKKYYPKEDLSTFTNRLNEIAEENEDPSIRFKAHLASIYLSFSDIIDVQPKRHVFDHEYIYKQITDQIESKLFVSN